MSDEDFFSLERKVEDIAGKLNEVHFALMGSSIAKDGGLIHRLIECEKGLEEVQLMIIKRDEILAAKEKKQIKTNVMVTLIWVGVSSFITWAISTIINSIKFYGK